MKTDKEKYKLNLAARAEDDIAGILGAYEAGRFEQLGRLCCALTVFLEYSEDAGMDRFSVSAPYFEAYLKNHFRESVALVLRGRKVHWYTASHLVKFIRGEYLHGASDNRDEHRKVLHDFIFEKDSEVGWLYLVGWNWIAGPNLTFHGEHGDSAGRMLRHEVQLNGRKYEVSIIESIVLAVAFEIWEASHNPKPKRLARRACFFDPRSFSEVLGDSLAGRIFSDLVYKHGWDETSFAGESARITWSRH